MPWVANKDLRWSGKDYRPGEEVPVPAEGPLRRKAEVLAGMHKLWRPGDPGAARLIAGLKARKAKDAEAADAKKKSARTEER